MTSASKRKAAIDLRRQGKSYGQIQKELGISSKGTLSYWFKNLQLSSTEKSKLKKNVELAQKRGLLKFNKIRSYKIRQENEESWTQGVNFLKSVTSSLSSDKIISISSIALFWAEGTKKVSSSNQNLTFTNSDPKMIKLYMRFLRECLKVPENKIKAGIHIHKNIPSQEAIEYWSKVMKIKTDIFYIVKVKSKSSKNIRPKNRLPFGTAVVRVSDRKLYHYVMGMLEDIKKADF